MVAQARPLQASIQGLREGEEGDMGEQKGSRPRSQGSLGGQAQGASKRCLSATTPVWLTRTGQIKLRRRQGLLRPGPAPGLCARNYHFFKNLCFDINTSYFYTF